MANRKMFFAATTALLTLVLSTEGMAANFKWDASEVKEITVTPNPAPALQAATIKCTWEGVGPLTFLEQSEAFKYLHKGLKPIVPGFIRVMDTDIQVLYVGGLPVGQTESREVKWSPLTSSIGKTVTVECVLDPEKKVHYSSKTIEVPVVAKQETATPASGAGLPDITSGPRVTVAGKYPVVWGQGISVSSAEARKVESGVCLFALTHETRNTGNATTGAFSRRWQSTQNPIVFTDTYPPIVAGGSVERTDTLPLRPGVNVLTLELDNLDQVKESNEHNNLFKVTITVTGNCGVTLPPSRSR